jgi:hypothetical protein
VQYDPQFFDWVAGVVKGEWPADEMDLGPRRYLFGQVENVLFEVDPQVFGEPPIPIVTSRTEFARGVPESEELHAMLLQLNQTVAAVTFGVKDERSTPGTLSVRASTTLIGDDALDPALIHRSLGECLSPAIHLLNGGFLAKVGGTLGMDVTMRELGVQ